jgi:hypothetical protein
VARILDVWGLARSKAFTVVVLVITAILVLMEAKYNIDLLSTISDPTANREVVGGLSQRGKLLAAFGITWAVARALLTVIRPFVFGLSVFLGLAFGVYHGIDTLYTHVIASLKPEVKVQGFALFSYRHDLLTEKLIDPDLPLPKNEPVIGKIFMGAFPMVLLDERYMLPVQDVLEVRADFKSKEVLAKAENEWPRYDAAMFELRRKYDEFIAESRKATDPTASEGEWRKYAAKMADIRSNYERYIDGSRRAAGHGARGTRAFRERSGGLSPNPNLSLQGFVNMIRTANHPEGEKMRREEGRQLGQRANGTPVYVRDMPYFLGHAEFLRWVGDLRRDSFAARGIKPNPKLTRDEFLNMLRASDTKDGAKVRELDATILGRRSDGSDVTLREIPYFLDHAAYLHWFTSQAEAVKNSVLPTAETVETFKDIQDVNSAVFLPPMAIITSLTSATTNALSLVVVLVGLALTRTSVTRSAGVVVLKFSSAIMMILFSVVLYLMPSHVFPPDTPLYDLETSLHDTVGFPGEVWSRLSNLQKLILRG